MNFLNPERSPGIAVGMSSSPAAVYAAEISHPKLRGRLTLLSALCTAIGMLFIYLLGYLIPVSIFSQCFPSTNWRNLLRSETRLLKTSDPIKGWFFNISSLGRFSSSPCCFTVKQLSYQHSLLVCLSGFISFIKHFYSRQLLIFLQRALSSPKLRKHFTSAKALETLWTWKHFCTWMIFHINFSHLCSAYLNI